MSFKDLKNIKLEYYTNEDNVVEDFYVPVLKETVTYKRAVGFFSSNILLEVSVGLYEIAKRGGKIQLVIAPKLDKKDYDAIKAGYDVKEYIDNLFDEAFDESVDVFQKEDRFALLSYLISRGILDIKVAYLEENNDNAMFHAKYGVMFDEEANMISFSGSSNETHNGFFNNAEQIDVFCDWTSEDANSRCIKKSISFNKLWNKSAKGVIILPFPEVIKNRLLKYEEKNFESDFESLDKKLNEYLKEIKIKDKKKKIKLPYIPDDVHLHDYQENAISKWVENGYKGIFDMATGTGKTFTGYGAITKLFDDKKRCIVVVSCPYTHLVDQWCEEATVFNIEPIKCYGNFSDYEKNVKRSLTKYKQKLVDFVCIIVSNSSFRGDKFQALIKDYIGDILLVVDEAHNFGAFQLSQTLNNNYPYRLALSATLDRYGDEYGTQLLYNFFGNKCIEYSLKDAIVQKKLTPYKYYPIVVGFNCDEWDAYLELSKKIAKYSKCKDIEHNKTLKNLLIKRARLVASTQNKISRLTELMNDYKNDNNILIYCGAVKYGDSLYDECDEEKRQIEIVIQELYKKYKMRLKKFTAEEDSETRKLIKKSFQEGELQALVAIKCLDEGVNIPAIKTAFILASSTNPKEYIQRRGRVLRLAKGKQYAEIYDFITLPNGLEGFCFSDEIVKRVAKNLVRKELDRVVDFVSLASNASECNNIIDLIKDTYELNIITEGEDLYE